MEVSVIIPVYNAEKYIEQCVESAVHLNEVKEILLVDDQSPDNALEICQQLAAKYPKVIVLQHPDQQNHGAGPTRNLGLQHATKNYVAFLDADDTYLESRFKKEKEYLQLHKSFEGFYGATGVAFYTEGARKIFATSFHLKESEISSYLTTLKQEVEPIHLFETLNGIDVKTIGHLHLNGLTLKRESLLKHNIRFAPELRLHQDTVFIYKCAYYLSLLPGSIDEAVALRGVHEDNRITKNSAQKRWKTRRLMFQHLVHWSEDLEQKKIHEFYYFRLLHADFQLAGFFGKIRLYCKGLFGPYKFLKSRFARVIHFGLFHSEKQQNRYNRLYLRLHER